MAVFPVGGHAVSGEAPFLLGLVLLCAPHSGATLGGETQPWLEGAHVCLAV